MRPDTRRLVVAGLVLASAAFLAAACSGARSGPGQLSVALVDAPPIGVDQISVNVTQVTAHSDVAGWFPVSTTPMRLDLLRLQASPVVLGSVQLAKGRITQLRLYVSKDGNWVHVTGDPDGVQTPLVVPSGYESGIKILGPWDVGACTKTSVTLDFDGLASLEVHPTGSGSEWILRPVVKVKKTDASPVACEEAPGTGDAGVPACDTDHPCAVGQVCTEGACVAESPPLPPTSSCTSNQQCISGSCGADGTCAQSLPNGPCRVDSDCTDAKCQPDGSCAPCTSNADCPATLTCTSGSCLSAAL